MQDNGILAWIQPLHLCNQFTVYGEAHKCSHPPTFHRCTTFITALAWTHFGSGLGLTRCRRTKKQGVKFIDFILPAVIWLLLLKTYRWCGADDVWKNFSQAPSNAKFKIRSTRPDRFRAETEWVPWVCCVFYLYTKTCTQSGANGLHDVSVSTTS